MNFRTDINGLRAIAVIAVVVFHFSPDWLPGGFAGVDVFFVISGFLMTKIIFSGLENNTFSILRFYIARAKRIIPALAVLCLVLLVLGWFYLTPVDYRALSEHVVSSMAFLSNITYWKESGYFDAEARGKWLLHTWSLSVEWQFYILYPLMLVTMKKFMDLKTIKIVVPIAAIIGLVLSVFATYRWPVPAYYLLPTRGWEMLAGGVAYLYPFTLSAKNKPRLELAGIILILTSYFLISKENTWPGYLAIIPVLGAFFIIQSQRTESALTNNALLQHIGNWSYSIYLWHWPLVVVISRFELSKSGAFVGMGIGIVLSLLFGYISSQYIENGRIFRIKDKVFFKARYIYVFCITLGLSVIFYGNYIYNIPDYIWRIQNLDVRAENYGKYTWRRINLLKNKIEFNDNNKKNILIIGDSQAGDITNAIFEKGVAEKYEIAARVVSARCGVFYLNNKDQQDFYAISDDVKSGAVKPSTCENEIKSVSKGEVIKNADYIILSMNWRDYAVPFILKSIANLKKESNATIYLIGNKGLGNTVGSLTYEHYFSKTDYSIANYVYKKLPRSNFENDDTFEYSAKRYGFNFISMMDVVCPEGACQILNKIKQPLYYDKLHTTKEGATYIGGALIQIMHLL
jgi:peptidoglycan/LPS O-acetylase OafA/YrhL